MTRKRLNVLGITEFANIFARYPIAVTGQVDSRFLTASAPCSRLRRATVCRHGGQWPKSRLSICDSRLERGAWHLTKKRRSSRGSQRTFQTSGEGRVDYIDRFSTTRAIYPIFPPCTEAGADQKKDNGW